MAMNNTKRYIWVMINQLQLASNELTNFNNARDIDTITGALLDIAGVIVGENRQGKNDDDYRTAIKYRILLNNSNGEPETIIQSLRIFMPSIENIKYSEIWPAKINLDIINPGVPPDNLRTLIEQIAPAGVKIFIKYVPGGEAFAFDGEGGYPPASNTLGFNEEGVGNENTGGRFAEEI